MYIAKAVAQSDFASALYGPVYRLDYRKWFEGTDNPEELLRLKSQARGRVSAYTASLVDARFGKRFRNWFEHVPYTIDVPMLKEVSEVWQSEVAEVGDRCIVLKQCADSHWSRQAQSDSAVRETRSTHLYSALSGILRNIGKLYFGHLSCSNQTRISQTAGR